jgi:hypothetical protein
MSKASVRRTRLKARCPSKARNREPAKRRLGPSEMPGSTLRPPSDKGCPGAQPICHTVQPRIWQAKRVCRRFRQTSLSIRGSCLSSGHGLGEA